MDIKRIAAMIAECDDDAELAEVLAEVYRMLPGEHQAAFLRSVSAVRVVIPEKPVKVIDASPGKITVVPATPAGGTRAQMDAVQRAQNEARQEEWRRRLSDPPGRF